MIGSIRPVIVKLIVFVAFTLSVTGLLAAVIGNIQPFTDFYDVNAEFSDATGLLKTDVVKVAGVTIGKVTGAEVDRRGRAVVKLAIRKDVTLPGNVRAAIRFRNLLGQRMVELSRDPSGDTPPLPRNGRGRIPLARTSPALDLGIVFNNLQPVLQALDPEDANLLSQAVVKIFAGREERLHRMIADLADLAQTLGDRGPIVANLVRELNVLVTNLAARDDELQSILTSFDQVLGTLGSRSGELARAAENIGAASNGLADLIEGNRPALDQTLSQLSSILALAASHKQDLDTLLKTLPKTAGMLNRVTTYGEWVNLVIVCQNGVCGQGFGPTSTHGIRDVFTAAAGGAR